MAYHQGPWSCNFTQAKKHIVSSTEYALPADRATAHAGLITPSTDTRDMLGRPLRDLRLSAIDQCNFRCRYCMPREVFDRNYRVLPSSARLSFEQMVKMAKAFTSVGVEEIQITGGEPLPRRNLEALVEQLATLETASGKPMEVALTTNGSVRQGLPHCTHVAGWWLRPLEIWAQ